MNIRIPETIKKARAMVYGEVAKYAGYPYAGNRLGKTTELEFLQIVYLALVSANGVNAWMDADKTVRKYYNDKFVKEATSADE